MPFPTPPSFQAPPEVPPELAQAQAALADLSAAEFQAWRHHPLTQVFLRYLRDYRRSLEASMLDRWREGTVQLADEGEARGRSKMALEIDALTWNNILDHYGVQQSKESSDA